MGRDLKPYTMKQTIKLSLVVISAAVAAPILKLWVL